VTSQESTLPKKEDKAAGKQKEVSESLKNPNPYARPILGKCFKCNQPGIVLVIVQSGRE